MSKTKISKFGLKLDQKETVESLLAEVNGRSSAWVIGDHFQVVDAAKKAEEALEKAGIVKTKRKGAVALVYGGSPTSKNYKYAVNSTFIRLRRAVDDWRIEIISRIELSPGDGNEVKVQLTPEQREIVQRVALAPFGTVKIAA